MTETLNRRLKQLCIIGSGLTLAGSPLSYSSEIATSEDTPKSIQTQIKGERTYEECLPLKAHQSLSYQFHSSQKLVFNVHYHDRASHDTIYLVEPMHSASLERQSYSTTSNQVICLMWENPSASSIMLNYLQQVKNAETN